MPKNVLDILLSDNRILAIATLLGGVAAVWFFWDKLLDCVKFFRRLSGVQGVQGEQRAIRKLERESTRATRGLTHELLVPFLTWYYDVHPCEVGPDLPALILPIDPAAKVGSGSGVLADWDCSAARANVKTDWAFEDRRFVELRKRAGLRVENRQTFCLDRIDVQGGRPIVRSNLVGAYEDCLATCDAMEWELLLALAAKPLASNPEAFAKFAKQSLPLRNAAKAFCKVRSESPVFTGLGRSAAIAVSTLTLARRDDNAYVTFLGHRSGKTAAHRRLLHVAPAGMLQPIHDWQKAGPKMDSEFYAFEWSLKNHVLRELAEELFDRDDRDLLTPRLPETPDAMLGFDEIEELNRRLSLDQAELFVTGVVVNLLNLRPELATVLLIHDPTWYTQHSRGTHGHRRFARNWEYLDDRQLDEFNLPRFWLRTLWSPASGGEGGCLETALAEIPPNRWVVPGLAAYKLGIDFIRKHLRVARS